MAHTAKMEVCISYLGYAPCNSEVVKYIPLELQGAYPRYGIHSYFRFCSLHFRFLRQVLDFKNCIYVHQQQNKTKESTVVLLQIVSLNMYF